MTSRSWNGTKRRKKIASQHYALREEREVKHPNKWLLIATAWVSVFYWARLYFYDRNEHYGSIEAWACEAAFDFGWCLYFLWMHDLYSYWRNA